MADARYDPHWKWKTVRTEHFTIYYPEGHEQFAARVLALSEEVKRDVSGYFGIAPRRCPIVLNPGTDMLNGFYSPFPNRISLYETPGTSLRGYGGASDIVDLVFTHEYTHFVHITSRLGRFGALTRIVGDGSSVTNGFSPLWVIEGITTNMETRFTDGGRGRCPYFRGIMLSFSEGNDFWGLNAAGASNPYSPPGGRFYIVGYHMVEYLNRTYGDDAFARLNRIQAMKPIGGTSNALHKITRLSSADFYKKFREDFLANAERHRRSIDADNLPSGTVLIQSPREDYSSLSWTERGTVMALRTGYDKTNAFVEVSCNGGALVSTIETGKLFALSPATRTTDGRFVFGSVFMHPLGEFDIDTADIVVFDPLTKKHRRITHDAHIFAASLSPDGKTFAAARRNGMWIDLVLLDADGRNCRTLVSREGLLFDGPVWSPDGSSIAVAVKNGKNTDIAYVDPSNGAMRTLFAPDEYEDISPSFSPDGRWILFASGRSGVWNIHAWDTHNEKLYQLTSVYYNADEPEVSPDGGMLAFTSMLRGVNRICVLPFEPENGRPVSVDAGGVFPEPSLDTMYPQQLPRSAGIPFVEAYRPYIHSPWFSADEKGTSAGLMFMGGDPLNINAYSASIQYGLESDRAGYDVFLANRSFWPTFGLRIYDRADLGTTLGGRERWTREHGGELSISGQVINAISPVISVSSFQAGVRARSFESLEENEWKFPERRALSWFGTVAVIQKHDTAPRAMADQWSTMLTLSHERSVEYDVFTLTGHNSLVSFTLGAPSPIRHHGFSFGIVHQNQEGHIWYDRSGALPRGYASDTTSGGLLFGKTLLFASEYRFPLAYPDTGVGMMAYHVNRLDGALFYDYGGGWGYGFDFDTLTKNARASEGVSLTARSSVFLLPLDITLMFGYKQKERETFTRFYLIPRL